MAEKSYFWSCVEVGDGGNDSFSQEAVMTMLGMFGFTYDPQAAGVIPWKNTNTSVMNNLGLGTLTVTGELTPTYTGTAISIASGLAMVGGQFYINTSANIFSISSNKSGYANATDRIVLRRNLVAQTVRLVWLQAGGAGLSAILTQNNTYWDVPIASVTLDGSGNYSSLTDDRTYVTSPSANKVVLGSYTLNGTGVGPITFNNISQAYNSLELEVSGSISVLIGAISVVLNNDFGGSAEYILSANGSGHYYGGTGATDYVIRESTASFLFPQSSVVTSKTFQRYVNMTFPNYTQPAGTDIRKKGLYRANTFQEGAGTVSLQGLLVDEVGSWEYTFTSAGARPGPITRIDVQFGSACDVTDMRVRLWGVK